MRKILTIDDKKNNLTTIEAIIKNNIPDCEVLTALSGKEGIDIAKKEHPDTILLDIIMPKMDGYEVCKKLKEDGSTKHIPVMMITAIKTDKESRIKGLDIGADAFFSKPIDPVELSSQLNVMLRIKGAEDKLRADKEEIEERVKERIIELSEKNKKLQLESIRRKKTEDRLKESEERLSQITENSREWIWEVDINGLYTFASQVIETSLGYTQEEIIGKKYFYDFFLPEEREELKKAAFDVFKQKQPFNEFINRNLAKDGEIVWFSTSGVPILDDNGNLLGYRGGDINITESKKAEAKLKEQAVFVQQNPAPVFRINNYGIIIALNNAAQGLSKDLRRGKSVYAILENLSKLSIKNLTDDKQIQIEETIGSQTFLFTIKKDTTTQAIYFFGSNITEHKQAEEALQESEEKFRNFVETSADLVFRLTKTGRIDYVSPRVVDLYGYHLDELIGKHLRTTTPIGEVPRAIKVLRMVFAGESLRNFEINQKHKAGHIIPMEINAVPVYQGRKIVGLQGIMRDITERKKAENDLKAALEKATESDRLKSTFLATMSHELRTPLNGIIGFAQLLNSESSREEVEEFAIQIHKSGNRLLKIIEDMFDFTLIETGAIKIAKEEKNIRSLLDDILLIIKAEQEKLNKPGINIRLNPKNKNKDLYLLTNHNRLKQILINLLNNALKFTDDGVIEFGYEEKTLNKQHLLQFYVSDTGIGIPKEKQNVIFDIFRQVEDSSTRRYGGVGISLSIAKRLTELLGGSIWLESEAGKGSIFYFTIPFDKFEKSRDLIIDETKKKHSLTGKTVLIVEDVESSFEVLNLVLKRSGIKCIWAKDGQKAIELCKENTNINLVLMDINMPDMNGYEATKKIKKIRPKLPIIAQTAYALLGDEEKSLDAGCDDYISKPIKRELLMEKLGRFLGK